MTLSDFRTRVSEMVKRWGIQYPNQTAIADLNSVIQTGLNSYAKITGCLYSPQVTFTPVVNQQIYQTINNATNDGTQLNGVGIYVTVFARPMCNIEQVFLNGAPLQVAVFGGGPGPGFTAGVGWQGGGNNARYGESSLRTLLKYNPNYLTSQAGTPGYFFQEPPNSLVFNCPFATVPANTWVSGQCYHSPLLSDNQVLDLAPEDVFIAARYVRNILLEPYNPNEYPGLKAEVDAEMLARKEQCTDKTVGVGQRGTGQPRKIVNLVN